jgi:hypothetical protein
MTIHERLAQLRDEAAVLVSPQAAEGEARSKVLRDMYDAGLAAMAEKLLTAHADTAAARAQAAAEVERARTLEAEIEQRDHLLRSAAERDRTHEERIATLQAERDNAVAEAVLADAARERAETARRDAFERAHMAAEDAAVARAEADEARRQRDDAEDRAAIATSEAAAARLETIENAARARLDIAELQERLAAALAERVTAFADRDKAEREHVEMRERLNEALIDTAAATQEAVAARARAQNAAGALRAITEGRITLVGDTRGEVAALARSGS